MAQQVGMARPRDAVADRLGAQTQSRPYRFRAVDSPAWATGRKPALLASAWMSVNHSGGPRSSLPPIRSATAVARLASLASLAGPGA
ncbi:MAG TPA: hypothetical protein VGS58_00890, partial [Candidatus Sulfopaludibacter sp.]|nr:hypothetical protein [Candidatus Sulfopaludibacter sp.]